MAFATSSLAVRLKALAENCATSCTLHRPYSSVLPRSLASRPGILCRGMAAQGRQKPEVLPLREDVHPRARDVLDYW